MQIPDPVVLIPHENLWKLLRAVNPDLFSKDFRDIGPLLALDPGETTGVALFEPTAEVRDRGIIRLWQLETKDIGQSTDLLHALCMEYAPKHVRYEDYRIYHWLAESQAWSQLHTVRLIGGIQTILHQDGIPHSEKLAQQAKAFWTDPKLKATNTYAKGLKHARDATRHLLYYMSFDI